MSLVLVEFVLALVGTVSVAIVNPAETPVTVTKTAEAASHPASAASINDSASPSYTTLRTIFRARSFRLGGA